MLILKGKPIMTFKELKQTYDKPFERIKHMSNGQIVICTLAFFLALCVITVILYPLTNGTPVIGRPSEKNIERIEVTDTRKSDEVIVTDDENMIFFAHNVVNYLNYTMEKVEECPEDLFITIKYIEKDGTVTELSASENYLLWKGKYHKLVKPGIFSAYVEGVFYDKTVIVTKE